MSDGSSAGRLTGYCVRSDLMATIDRGPAAGTDLRCPRLETLGRNLREDRLPVGEAVSERAA